MAPKGCFVVEISGSMKCIPKYPGEGARSLEPYDQVVKVGEGWVDLEPAFLSSCWVAR